MFDRELAGFPVTEKHFREGIPQAPKYIGIFYHESEFVSRYLPEFSREIDVPELPEWRILVRDNDPDALEQRETPP